MTAGSVLTDAPFFFFAAEDFFAEDSSLETLADVFADLDALKFFAKTGTDAAFADALLAGVVDEDWRLAFRADVRDRTPSPCPAQDCPL
ncbi:MAG: hypothetical protein LBN33_02275 [Desulfovibrio sp.]|nr:hypothetical protein [Desulfovibrio sp.]